MDINLIIDQAKALGITLTNANLGTVECQRWEAKVTEAATHMQNGKMGLARRAIKAANLMAL